RAGTPGRRPPRRSAFAARGRRIAAGLRALREVAKEAPPREAMSRLAEEERRSVGRPLEAEDDPHERRLAPAVRAGDSDELANAEPKVDVFEHALSGPVAERHPGDLDG